MATDRFILDGNGEPIPFIGDFIEWAHAMESEARIVEHSHPFPDVLVSTVFLSLDHNFSRLWGGGGEPIYWESMIFGGPYDQEQWRCGGPRSEALKMHKRALCIARLGGASSLLLESPRLLIESSKE